MKSREQIRRELNVVQWSVAGDAGLPAGASPATTITPGRGRRSFSSGPGRYSSGSGGSGLAVDRDRVMPSGPQTEHPGAKGTFFTGVDGSAGATDDGIVIAVRHTPVVVRRQSRGNGSCMATAMLRCIA